MKIDKCVVHILIILACDFFGHAIALECFISLLLNQQFSMDFNATSYISPTWCPNTALLFLVICIILNLISLSFLT
jgi:hypothetical protein